MVYDVVGLLGRGGSAVVELAVDGSGRRVARKRVLLAGSAAQIHAARVRLRREAEILSSLAHPGIVPVLDVVDDGTDVMLVMPAMAENLEDRVRRLGPLPAEEVAALGAVLLEALAAAHRHGVVHRDIKPANVLFDERGAPALADFGAAVTAEMTVGLTGAGTVLGTPMWMAPEQARGGPAGPPADVFSLGATLGFAACGHGPYQPGPPPAVLDRASRGEVRPLSARVPPHLRPALTAMLDPDPARRPSAAAVLGGVGGTVSAAAPPPARRRRWPLLVASAAAGTALLAGAFAAVTGTAAAKKVAAPPPTACSPLPYQACGAPAPAPHTDGRICLPGWYDLDGSPADGCESRSDFVAGTVLTQRAAVHANLVPPDTTDSFATHVAGHAMNLCWGALHVTLTAPAGTAERMEVLEGRTVLASALSADGAPATASVVKPSCIGADSEDLTVTVSQVAATGASAATDFTLTRDSGW